MMNVENECFQPEHSGWVEKQWLELHNKKF